MPGKVVVITGAAGGLGRALTRRLVAEGETVVMLGRTLSKLEEVAQGIDGGTGEKALPIACDIASPASVRAAFAQIADRFGKIDALINNAGVFRPQKLVEAEDDVILGTVTANLAGPLLCARSAIPLLKRGGHIINVTSESVIFELPYLSIYQAAKAGVERLTTALIRELHDNGIRVTTVRAGTMVGEGMSSQMTPEEMMAMMEESKNRGHDMMTRGYSSYESTLPIFSLILNSPDDLHIASIGYHGLPENFAKG